MTRRAGFRRLLTLGFTRRSIERDVDAEIGFHVHMRIEDLMRQGKSRDAAKTQALREYGDIAAARSELAAIDRRRARQNARSEWFSSLWQDIRFGARGLRSRPGFTITVLLTLALGVGANAAIFSVVDSVLLRPLPFARPERLVHLWETFEGHVDRRSEASFPDYLDWRARNTVFSDLAGYHGAGFLFGGAQPRTVGGGKVTANFFDVVGVRAVVGRTFATGEDAPDASRVVLLTYGFWQREFAGDRNVAGRSIILDGSQATIVGVLPESFRFAPLGGAELIAPIDRSQSYRENRGNHWLKVVGRLREGVSLEVARQNMSMIMGALAKEYPPTNAGRDGVVVPLHDELVGSVRPVLLLVYGAVIVVLLIACVNVANLLLIRGADRQREIAVRVALGAGKTRLVRQLLTESLLLAVCGGVLGLGVARLGVSALVDVLPAQQMRGFPTLTGIALNSRIVVYALIVSFAAGIGFGIIPALRLSKLALHDALRSAGRGAIGGASRLRDGLVMGEIALTVILMSGALLFGRSLLRLLAVDPGFRVEHVATTNVVLANTNYPSAAAKVDFFRRFTDGVRQLPGVEAVGMVSKLPLDFGNSLGFEIAGRPASAPGQTPTASYRQASTDYFRAMGIPVVRGRAFGSGDDASAPLVGVVNRSFATAYFPNQDPIGQVLLSGKENLQIVGVVGDVPIGNIEDKIPPTLYFAFDQSPQTSMAIVTRSTIDPAQLAPSIRAVVAKIDPTAALSPVVTMDELITRSPSIFMRRFPLYVVGAFAVTALLLAVVGIYGVVSYSVAQRTREMGIRMALGAQPGTLVRLVVQQGGSMALAGIVTGVLIALALGRFAEKLLYGVTPSDPLTYVIVAGILAVVAIGATLLPARRATRVDPAIALRGE